MWEIVIDGIVKSSMANNDPRVWNNVKAYIAGETFTILGHRDTYESTVGEYKNFSLKTTNPSSTNNLS